MGYSWPVIIHVAAGGAGIVSGFAALAVRKGERGHRLAGTVFFVSMLTMAGFAWVMSLLAVQKLNIFAASFTLYLVATAWMAVRREPGRVAGFETFAAAAAFSVAAVGLAIGLARAAGIDLPEGPPPTGSSPVSYFVFAGMFGLAAAQDLKVIRSGGLTGSRRIARHLWRMCLALAIAAGSFFLGQADELPAAWRGPHLSIPPLAALAALAYWLARVNWPRRPPATA